MSTPPLELESASPLVLDHERTVWLTALYETNVRSVIKTCRRLLDDPEEAADATQEVFIRAATALHTAPDGKDAAAWLTTVARNYCLDVLRRRRKFQSALTTLGGGVALVEAETAVDDRQLAQAVLDQLAVRDRRALWESHVEERPVGEIAERLGLNYLATAQLLHRARRRAALVAAELAALLALLRLGLRRAQTQMQTNVQPVAAVVAVPIVMAGLVIASGTPSVSAPHRPVAVRPSALQPFHANPTQSTLLPTNPNTGLPPPTPALTVSSTAQQAAASSPMIALPSPAPPTTVSAPKPRPRPTGPPWKKGHHKLGTHGHGHSAS